MSSDGDRQDVLSWLVLMFRGGKTVKMRRGWQTRPDGAQCRDDGDDVEERVVSRDLDQAMLFTVNKWQS